jgi:hypothetical protein
LTVFQGDLSFQQTHLKRKLRVYVFLVFFAWAVSTPPLSAQQTYTWDNGTNTGLWGTSAN